MNELVVVVDIDENGKRRFKPFEGQFYQDDLGNIQSINPEWNVMGDRAMRDEAALGDIFALGDPKPVIRAKTKSYISTSQKKIRRITLVEAQEMINEARFSFNSGPEHPFGSLDSDNKLSKLLKDFPVPRFEEFNFYIDPNVWKRLLFEFSEGHNVLIKGDSGIGKTELIEILSKRLGKPFKKYDMGAADDAVETLVGTHRIKDGASYFDKSPFIEDVRQGSFILMDEINRCPEGTTNLLFPLLDAYRSVRLPMLEDDPLLEGRILQAHKDTLFFFTANVGGSFTGTYELDAAFTNRTTTIELNYPPEQVEADILLKKTGVPRSTAKNIVKILSKVRDKYKNRDVTINLSIRDSIKIAKMIYAGYDFREAFDEYCLPIYQDQYPSIKDIIHTI